MVNISPEAGLGFPAGFHLQAGSLWQFNPYSENLDLI